ncbi:zinc-binding alcohol dehydrogenase family protein [Aliidiomarina soli]|uniref:Zinc-type alcohol dehydrogenase-like protein n=1 Tax=Aliidiomarina soli TaxID=1928574 RepID=A0A432WF09_9GAMM|nr:zinc-binding alcohol dehydrogenase family protein [Aliidiomarina soli]RUO32344.1 zinc-binding alcohol dehydrogenase family protein [Aliidiomarina soli]
MQAIVARKGELVDVEMAKPSPQEHDILVQVQAVSVNPVDTKVRMRAKQSGDEKVLGYDAVGIVEAVGEQVEGFKPGDRIWYAGDVTRPGSNAEFQCVDWRIVSHAPKSLSDAEAAAIPLTVLTAWELLFDRLQLTSDASDDAGDTASSERVLLVVGAAGGVGSMLVQLARQLTKATVIGTASRPESKDWVSRCGAHHVIDHSEPLSAGLAECGLSDITDVASLTHTDSHFDELVRMLRPQGRFALIDDPEQALDIGSMKQKSLSLHWEFMFTRAMFKTADIQRQGDILKQAARLIDSGRLQTSLQQHLSPLNAATLEQAHQQLMSQRTVGKVVVTRD